jgi:hypothetical protein
MFGIRWRWIFFVLILFGAWKYWPMRSSHRPAGELAAGNPVQTSPQQKRIYQKGKYEFEVLADFDIEARVLSKENYSSDREAELSPVDLALGWGAMSDSAVLDKLSISQSGRFYFYHWDNEPPLPPSEIARHSANMHLIPANVGIEKQIKEVRAGQVVHISGQLVEARSTDGWHWRSSLTRDDTGAGACEVIRVESISAR